MYTDYFLNDMAVVERLVTEWREHGKLIIAYDFDNTVYDYYQKGHTFEQVISLLQRCQKAGAYFILFTSNEEEKHEQMIKYLHEHNIPFDKINENLDFIPFVGRKIYYNILLDDRAGLQSAYKNLEEAVSLIEKERI